MNWFRTCRDGSDGGGTSRLLKALGASWAACPGRRVVQSVFFVLFCVLFFYVCWPYGGKEYAEALRAKEWLEAEIFLVLDPLVSISTAIAARVWVWSLAGAGVILLVCVFIPRGFCAYVCPMGTLIDLFDWAVGRRWKGAKLKGKGLRVNLKYYVLVCVLGAAVFGVVLTGFVSAIAVVTRGMQFIFSPLQLGVAKGWYLVPAMNAGQWVSIGLFSGVLALGFLRGRFWCNYLCPTGAAFSAANLLRINERKVDANCIKCGRCARVCSFDAVNSDFSTKASNCTFCQTCGGVCPVGAIEFGPRWKSVRPPSAQKVVGYDVPVTRRRFMAGVGTLAACTVAAGAALAGRGAKNGEVYVRPPGSVPEEKFLEMCVRCGKCFKVCPNNVLQPVGLEGGLKGLWTPAVAANWSGCEPSCNNCGQVCPTGAIRALELEEKRACRIGLAVVDEGACLPYAGREACQMCADECAAAGYKAIEFIMVGVETDDEGKPIEGSGYLAPVVLKEKCVGCGLCQTRCYKINSKEKGRLSRSAIVVEAGEGKEDRIMSGSYIELRQAEEDRRKAEEKRLLEESGRGGDYLPDFVDDL